MRSFTCVSVVVYVARKLRPCLSYSRRRDRINLVLWRSLDKGGGGTYFRCIFHPCRTVNGILHQFCAFKMLQMTRGIHQCPKPYPPPNLVNPSPFQPPQGGGRHFDKKA